ncbi:S41 family peptidase [Deinococcus aquaedulcis]|uniref:S41 family peptidase n=1 Tax=Deinococcus aquaedulcis TaxID=2840455 RepID=UPI001C833CEF|nr:S41 family peptidase [Deinococcus aquaedulcis]
MTAEAQAYLQAALKLIQQEALYAGRLNWPEITAACERLSADAQTAADTYPALRFALAALGDHHSQLRLPDADVTRRGVFGIYFSRGVVAVVLPETPAERAGLQRGERITRLNGKAPGPGVNEGLPVGPQVTLELETAEGTRTVVLTRDDVPAVQPAPEGRLVAPGVGLVTLPECSLEGQCEDGRTYQDRLAGVLLNLRRQGAERWIVDLRLNLGGNMWPMLAGVGPLAGEGVLGAFVKGQEQWRWRHEAGQARLEDELICQLNIAPMVPVPTDTRVAVLTSPLTASSGEILTLSFVGRPGTRLFGESTRGLTTSNSFYTLPDGAALLVATALDADRTGRVYDSVIEPDVAVPIRWDLFQTADDPVLGAALAWVTQP